MTSRRSTQSTRSTQRNTVRKLCVLCVLCVECRGIQRRATTSWRSPRSSRRASRAAAIWSRSTSAASTGCSAARRPSAKNCGARRPARGVRVHVAIAGTRMAALVLASPGPASRWSTPAGKPTRSPRSAIGHLCEKLDLGSRRSTQSTQSTQTKLQDRRRLCESLRSLRSTDGDSGRSVSWRRCRRPTRRAARAGGPGVAGMARGEDIRPLVPDAAEERFESSLDLEWPIEGLEPLSFVLTRLLEPLSTRLERRDRGAAVLHVQLALVTRTAGTWHARRLRAAAPMRDVARRCARWRCSISSRIRRAAAIDRVTVVDRSDAGPRAAAHAVRARAADARAAVDAARAAGALMGQDRIGAPALVDSYRPGAFAMTAFAPITHVERRASRSTQRKICTSH